LWLGPEELTIKKMGGALKTRPAKHSESSIRRPTTSLLLVEYAKVRVRNAQGKYLTANQRGWTFSFDLSRAMVFDYLGEEMRAQLSAIARMQDLPLELIPVEPKDFLERCDRCQQLSAPSDICFNGIHFLCRRCNNWPE
jgi:hypothetical protein